MEKDIKDKLLKELKKEVGEVLKSKKLIDLLAEEKHLPTINPKPSLNEMKMDYNSLNVDFGRYERDGTSYTLKNLYWVLSNKVLGKTGRVVANNRMNYYKGIIDDVVVKISFDSETGKEIFEFDPISFDINYTIERS